MFCCLSLSALVCLSLLHARRHICIHKYIHISFITRRFHILSISSFSIFPIFFFFSISLFLSPLADLVQRIGRELFPLPPKPRVTQCTATRQPTLLLVTWPFTDHVTCLLSRGPSPITRPAVGHQSRDRAWLQRRSHQSIRSYRSKKFACSLVKEKYQYCVRSPEHPSPFYHALSPRSL